MGVWTVVGNVAYHATKKLIAKLDGGLWRPFQAESMTELPSLADLWSTELGWSRWTEFPMVITTNSTPPAKATNKLFDKAFYRRVGENLEMLYTYSHNDPNGASAGTGNAYYFGLPVGFNADTAKIKTGNTGFSHGVCGSGSVTADTEIGVGVMDMGFETNTVTLTYTNETRHSVICPNYTPFTATVFRVSFFCSIPVLEFA